MSAQRFLDRDIAVTLENRTNLRKSINLLYWYEELYAEMFAGIDAFDEQRILEIGSETSELLQSLNDGDGILFYRCL